MTIISGLRDEIKELDGVHLDMLSSRDIKTNDRRFNPNNMSIATQREIQLKSFRNDMLSDKNASPKQNLVCGISFERDADKKDASFNS